MTEILFPDVEFQATGGSVTRTAADRAASSIDIRDFGAPRDGSSTDATAVTSAYTLALASPQLVRDLNGLTRASAIMPSSDVNECARVLTAALAANPSEFYFDAPLGGVRTYRFLSRALAGFNVPSGCRLIGSHNAVLDFSAIGASGTAKTLFRASGTLGTTSAIAANVALGDFAITLAPGQVAALGIAAGDYIQIAANTPWISGLSTTEYKGEFLRALSVSGDTITTFEPTEDAYTTAEGAFVAKMTPSKAPVFEGLHVVGPGRWPTDETSDRGLSLLYTTGARVEGCKVDYVDRNAIRVDQSLDFLVDGCSISFDPKGAVHEQVQYGVVYNNGSKSGLIRNNTVYGGKHAYVQSQSGLHGTSRHIAVKDNWAYGTWHAAISTHENCEQLTAEGNRLVGCNVGLDVRVRKFFSANNVVTQLPDANNGVGILLGTTTEFFTSDNDFIGGGRFGVRLDAADVQLAGSLGPIAINIRGLLAYGQSQKAIELNYDDTSNERKSVSIFDLNTRDCGGVSISIDGTFDEVRISRADLRRATAGGGCITLSATTTDVSIDDVTWDANYLPPVLSGTRIRTRNLRQWGATAAAIRTLNAGGLLTLIEDISAVAANTGTMDTIENITVGGIGDRKTIFPDTGDTITVGNNSGGTGNVRTKSGADTTLVHMTLVCDGTLWREC